MQNANHTTLAKCNGTVSNPWYYVASDFHRLKLSKLKHLVSGISIWSPSLPVQFRPEQIPQNLFWIIDKGTIRWTARSIERSIFFFFLKSHISGPDDRNLPIFFPSVVYPLYLHVIIDLGHIWGPFMAEIDKMCQKSAFLVVPDFGYPQSRGPPWKLAHWKCCPNFFWWLLYMLEVCHFIFATFSNEKVFTVTANVTVTVVPLEFWKLTEIWKNMFKKYF